MTNFVENLCKFMFNSVCKFCVIMCTIINSVKILVQKSTYSHTFTNFFTCFYTVFSPPFLINFIHFSTTPITITTNKLIKRI